MLVWHQNQWCLWNFLQYRHKWVWHWQSLRQRHMHQCHWWLRVCMWRRLWARGNDDMWRYVKFCLHFHRAACVFLPTITRSLSVLVQTSTSVPRILYCVPSAVWTWWVHTSVNVPQATCCVRTRGCAKVLQLNPLAHWLSSLSWSNFWKVLVENKQSTS